MNESNLTDGSFMGYTLRRVQVHLPDRTFTPIPVNNGNSSGPTNVDWFDDTVDASSLAAQMSAQAIKARGEAAKHQAQRGLANPPGTLASMGTSATGSLIHQATQQMLEHASPSLALNQPLKPPAAGVWISTPRRQGKSSWYQTMKDIILKGTGMTKVDTYPVHMTGTREDPNCYDTEPAYIDPECSAYPHASPARAVPVIRVDVQPAFFVDDTAGQAMLNAIDSVCDVKHGASLAQNVYKLRRAVYRPLGLYRPDLEGPWTGDAQSSSLFYRQTIHLDDQWDIDLRHATGVYRAKGRAWLGVYVHGVVVSKVQPRRMAPTPAEEQRYFAHHRGQGEPRSMAFDLFVPVEPEIVTEEWGWGEDLESLVKDREENAARDARQNHTPNMLGNKWDRKAATHKSATQINVAQAAIDREARVLGNLYRDELKKRERARQVLYSYAWKAMMVAIMECRQITVEEK